MKVEKWVNVIDPAGVERKVRRVDAREIQEAVDALNGVAKAEPEVVVAEMVEVDDRSAAPKASKKAK